MCGGGPPPKPDYTEQNNQLIDDTVASNNALAEQWTDNVSSFNNALSGEGGFNERLTNFTNTLDNLDMADLWDDPNTSQNENPFQNLLSQGNQLQTDFSALTAPGSAPTFQTEVLGGGGSILEIPDAREAYLDSLNGGIETPWVDSVAGFEDRSGDEWWNPQTQLHGTIGSGITDALARLNDLNQQRQAEEERVGNAQDDMLRSLTNLNTQLGQAGIGDLNTLNSLESSFANLGVDRSTYDSAILDQMGGWSQSDALYDSLGAGIADLRSQREAEQQRIEDFEAGLLSASDNIWNQVEGATIADGALLDSLTGDIARQLRSANRFSSELGFDLSQETGELNALLSQVSALQNQREAEQSRVDSAQANFLDRARSLENIFSNGTIYDADRLAQYSGQLSDLQSDMGTFSSDLGFDFSAIDPQLAEAQAALDALNQQRSDVINPMFETINGLSADAAGLALEDADGRAELLQQIYGLRGEAAPYTGGRMDALNSQITGLLDTIDGQTEALGVRRDEINADAEELLEQIRSGSYMSQGEVDASRAQMDTLQAMVDQFGVGAASDEMAGMSDFLQAQTNRIQQDAQNLAAREAQAQAQANAQLTGDQLSTLMNSTNLTDEQIQQLVQLLSNEDDPQVQQLLGTFSANMGV